MGVQSQVCRVDSQREGRSSRTPLQHHISHLFNTKSKFGCQHHSCSSPGLAELSDVAMPMPASATSPSVSLAWSLPLVSEPLGVSLCHPKGSRAAWLLVWLTHGVGANYIGSRGSQRVATGTCHRRLRGEFTDGQAISIKPSSPPILLWITVLNPLNYLNSISVGILEASCSD